MIRSEHRRANLRTDVLVLKHPRRQAIRLIPSHYRVEFEYQKVKCKDCSETMERFRFEGCQLAEPGRRVDALTRSAERDSKI